MAKKTCACHENCDARECYLRRYPEVRRMDDMPDSNHERYMDEKCECPCHDEERELLGGEHWEEYP